MQFVILGRLNYCNLSHDSEQGGPHAWIVQQPAKAMQEKDVTDFTMRSFRTPTRGLVYAITAAKKNKSLKTPVVLSDKKYAVAVS